MTEQEVNNLIDSKIGKTKMSQLPEATQTSGLYSIGYTGNQSVKYKVNLLQGDPLTVRKTYQTEAEALADKNPIDTSTSLPLTVGQFISIVDDGEKNGIYRISSISGDGTMSLELQGKLGDLSGYTKTGGSTKTTKDIDDTKANHGYDSSPKTLKEVEDEIVQLAGDINSKKANKTIKKPDTDNWYNVNNAVNGTLDENGSIVGTVWRVSELIAWNGVEKIYSGTYSSVSGAFTSSNFKFFQYDIDGSPIAGTYLLSSVCTKHPDAVYFKISESTTNAMVSPCPPNSVVWQPYREYIESYETTPATYKSLPSDFLIKPTTNLLGAAELRKNTYLDSTAAKITYDSRIALSMYFLEVLPNKTYYINKFAPWNASYQGVGFLKDKYTFSDITQVATTTTFTTPSDCKYIVINGAASHNLFLKDSPINTGEYYEPVVEITTRSGAKIAPYIPFTAGKNKFDKTTMVVPGYIVDYVNKKIVVNPGGAIAVIAVNSGIRHSRNVVLSNVAGQYQGVLELISYNFTDNTYTLAAGAYNLDSFVTSANAKYIAITVKNGASSIIDTLQIEEGETSTDYEPYVKLVGGDFRYNPYISDELKQYIQSFISITSNSENDMKQINNLPPNYGVVLDDQNFRVYAPIRKVTDKSIEIFPKIVAVGGNVVVYAINAYTLEITENGYDSLVRTDNTTNKNRVVLSQVLPNSTNSIMQSCHVLPYSRNSASVEINDYRVIIVTRGGQIYHNKPLRTSSGTDDPQPGDHLIFEESVVWDMPHRRLPSKTENTFPFYLNPCVEEPTYSPLLNTDEAYVNTNGNGGFGISKTVNGINHPRFYITHNGVDLNPFRTMGGVVVEPSRIMLGTYNPGGDLAKNEVTRHCVFESKDGREFFAKYEFITDVVAGNPIDTTQIAESYIADSLSIIDRDIDFACSDNPSPTGLFKEKEKIVISSISKASPAIITTKTPHQLPNTGFLAIQRNATAPVPVGYEWMVNDAAGVNSYGNGLFFGYKRLSDNTFELREYISANNNNKQAHHIHSINRVKDGVVIGTGEEYYTGKPAELSTTLMGRYPQTHFIHLNAKGIATSLNSSENGLMRPLGFIIENDDTCIHASDSDIAGREVVKPNGTLYRGATGIFVGKLADINDRTKFETVLESPEVCFFFKKIRDMYIFTGNAGFIAISTDLKNWSTTHVRSTLFRFGGVDNLNRVCVDGLIIYKK